MSDERALIEAMERKKARLLEEAAAVDRELDEVRRLSVIAAKYNLVVSTPDLSKNMALAEDGTIAALIQLYRESDHSPYSKLQFKTRKHYDSLIKRLERECGSHKLADLKRQDFLRLYNEWTEGGTKKLTMAHSLITMLRGLVNFGVTGLGNSECERLSIALHNIRIPVVRKRTEQLTAKHAQAIVDKANEMGLPSIALAQAFQFDCTMSQNDVIGEWVPISELGVSEITHRNVKWRRGLRWEEIDASLVLRHGDQSEQHLRKCPLVSQELARRGKLPKRGPVIVSEKTGLPWAAAEFRRQWRKIARLCGISDEVKNMDSRRPANEERKKERPVGANAQPTGRVR